MGRSCGDPYLGVLRDHVPHSQRIWCPVRQRCSRNMPWRLGTPALMGPLTPLLVGSAAQAAAVGRRREDGISRDNPSPGCPRASSTPEWWGARTPAFHQPISVPDHFPLVHHAKQPAVPPCPMACCLKKRSTISDRSIGSGESDVQVAEARGEKVSARTPSAN